MKKNIITSALALAICFTLAGCSYYGTNTFLVPTAKDRIIKCSEIQIEILGVLTDQDKKANAFAGIPYSPSLIKSNPPGFGELNVRYSNLPDGNICTPEDLLLIDIVNNQIISPAEVLKSKLVNQGGMKYLGCNYKFGNQLNAAHEYAVRFKDGFLGCKISDVPMKIEKDQGYHQVLLQ